MKPESIRARLRMQRFGGDEQGLLDLGKAMGLVGTIVGAVVVVLLLAALVPTFFGGVADLNENLSDDGTTTGDATADTILRVFPIVIGIAAAVGIVGLAVAAVQIRRGRR